MQQRAHSRTHLPAALLKLLAAKLRTGRACKLADAARQRRLADVHHRHHIALALLKACRGAGVQVDRCAKPATHWQVLADKQLAPWMWAARNRAAPQMPDGRRPVCIQSRFMDATSCSAVLTTAFIFFPKPSRSAKRFMYRLGSTGLRIGGACRQPGMCACIMDCMGQGRGSMNQRFAPLEHGQLLHVQRLA